MVMHACVISLVNNEIKLTCTCGQYETTANTTVEAMKKWRENHYGTSDFIAN